MDKEQLRDFAIIGAVGGAIAALCLSFFRTLSALAIGGMIGVGAFAALVAFLAIIHYVDKDSFTKDDILPFFAICSTSVAIGVGLATAANDILPGIFAKWYTAVVAGAVIGAIGLVLGCLALEFLIEKFEKEPDPLMTGLNAAGRAPNLENVQSPTK